MRILLAGGGTAGSVSPLLALAEEIRERDSRTEFLFVGTTTRHPEETLAKTLGIPFETIPAGKWRRYTSIRNLTDPFRTLAGFRAARNIITRFRPTAVLTAGSFVAVPVSFAARRAGIPVFVHQQDLVPSLTNRLLSRSAAAITVTLEPSLQHFPRSKTFWTGNPVRRGILEGKAERILTAFPLQPGKPIILVMGGGTGARSLNEVVLKSLPDLLKACQIVHLTGLGRSPAPVEQPGYLQEQFVTKAMPDFLAAATLIICRAGMGTLSELAALGKPAIVVPMPDSHQEANASFLLEHRAAVVIRSEALDPETLISRVRELLNDEQRRRVLGTHLQNLFPANAAPRIVDLVERTLL